MMMGSSRRGLNFNICDTQAHFQISPDWLQKFIFACSISYRNGWGRGRGRGGWGTSIRP